MKDLSVLIVGGGSGLGALLARMAVEDGASKLAIIDINREAAETALETARANGLPDSRLRNATSSEAPNAMPPSMRWPRSSAVSTR